MGVMSWVVVLAGEMMFLLNGNPLLGEHED